jgi:predicted cupin superfamily sugar epimerase
MPTVQDWIRDLGLQRHPEGGYYRETYRCAESIPRAGLPERFSGSRVFSTAILFLLEAPEFSAFHRIKSDEVWHFLYGSALLIHAIQSDGSAATMKLGLPTDSGAEFQRVVPAGCWFAAELAAPATYALVGCTAAPGFDFVDFELGRRSDLLRLYPQHRVLIERLTYGLCRTTSSAVAIQAGSPKRVALILRSNIFWSNAGGPKSQKSTFSGERRSMALN